MGVIFAYALQKRKANSRKTRILSDEKDMKSPMLENFNEFVKIRTGGITSVNGGNGKKEMKWKK